MEVFNRVLCKESIKLEPRCLDRGFKDKIFTRLRKRVEGVCSKHGYIKHNTVEIYKISPGTVELVTLSGNVLYDVYFYADICNPLVGNVMNAVVSNVNRFGILANAGYIHNGKMVSVLDIIIAKTSVKIKSDVDLNSVKVGDELKIEILGKKLELGESKISTIGRVIKDVPVEKPRKSCKDIEGDMDEIASNNELEALDDLDDFDDPNNSEDSEDSNVSKEDSEDADEIDETEDDIEDIEDIEEVKNGGGSENFFSDDGNVFSDDDNFADDAVDDEVDDVVDDVADDYL